MKKILFYNSKNHHADESLINLTPLIDVVFVVLIAFILIAPLLEIDRIELAKSSSGAEKNLSGKSHLAIYVHADNSIWINNCRINEKELAPLLKGKRELQPFVIPHVYHDAKACFGTYQTIKGALEKAGFKEMDIILKPGSGYE